MEINHLKVFMDVVRLGSFAAVAREEGTDPSSVSRHIAGLEAELGICLFERTTRRLSLTDAGTVYLDRIAPLVDGLRSAADAARDTVSAPSGTLRLTTSVAFGERWLMPRVASFQKRYPDIHLELLLTDAQVDITAERIDLAIRHAPSVAGDFVVTKLLTTRYRVVASADYVRRFGLPESPEQLALHRGVFFPYPMFQQPWSFHTGPDRPILKARPRSGLTVSSALAVRRAVLEGLGVALLADWMIDSDIRSGRLVDLFPAHAVSVSDFRSAAWILYPSKRHVPTRLRVFIDHLLAERDLTV